MNPYIVNFQTVLMQDRRGRVICVQCESASMANAAQAQAEARNGTGKMTNGTRETADCTGTGQK